MQDTAPHTETITNLSTLLELCQRHGDTVPENADFDLYAGQVEIGIPIGAGPLEERQKHVAQLAALLQLGKPSLAGTRFEARKGNWTVYTPGARR